MRHRVGERLRRWADRIDRDGAPRYIGYSFTIAQSTGVVFRQDGAVQREYQNGCPLMYRNHSDYMLALERAARDA